MKSPRSSARLAALPLAVLTLTAAAGAAAQSTAINTGVLPETVVTANRVAGPRDAQPFGTSVITQAEIRRSGATTVNEAIMRLLGVVGRQDMYGGGNYALDLRGFGTTADSNQVIMLDGVRLSEADLGGTRLAGIPIESVLQIEIIRGSGAVLYGEGATGGVIHISTQAGTGAARTNAGSVYLAGGSYGLREARTNVTLASGGFSLDVSGAQRESENYRDNARAETDAVSAVAQWSNAWLRVGASHAQDSLDGRLPGSLTAAQYRNNPRQTATPIDTGAIKNTRDGLFAEATLGNWLIAGDINTRTKALRSTSAFGSYAYDIKASGHALRATHTAQDTAFTNRLVLGTDYARWQRDVLGAFGNRAEQDSRAYYVRDELTLASSGTVFSAGARTENISKSISGMPGTKLGDRQNAWELGVSQPLSTDWSVYGRVGQSFRLANADEFSFTSPGVSLLPQRSRDVELGSRYASGPFKLEARWYRSKLRNEIGYDPTAPGPFGFGANVNFDPTQRTGLELDARYVMDTRLTLRANAALRKSTFTAGPFSGNAIPLAPNKTLAVHADWTPAAGHLVSGGVNWVGSQRPDFQNRCSMPAYATVDARYAYQWKNAEVSVGLSNMLNRKFYTSAFGCSGTETNGIYPESGRAVTVALRLQF